MTTNMSEETTNPPSSKKTTKGGSIPNGPEVAIIQAAPEELIWPDESLPERTQITRRSVREQVASAYGKRMNSRDQRRITEALWNRFEFDTPYSRYYNIERLGVPGKFTILREWTWPERFDVLERCHQAWERNPLARAGVEWTTHFVVGSGGQVTYHNDEVRQILEDFRNDPVNDIRAAEREACLGLQVDGEILYRYYKNRQGRTVIIPIRPWHIHWIDTAEQNYKQPVSYHYVYTIYRSAPGQSDFGTEDVKVEDMVHVAINKYSYELRGRPDIFSILPWLKAYRDWLEERARLNRRKTIYYVMTLKNASPGQVTAMQSQYSQPPAPGSFLVVNENVTLESVESHISAEEALEDGRQIKLMAISGMLMPEFYFADAAQSTLASATAQSLPVLRKFSDYQEILAKQLWIPVYRHVLQNAIDAKRIKARVPEQDSLGRKTGKTINALDAFSYEYPEIKEKDPHNLAQALQIATTMKWASNTTASVKMGFDPNKERELTKLEGMQEQGIVTPTPLAKPNGEKPIDQQDQKAPGTKPVMPIAPDSPQGQVQDRMLMPSQSAPNYPGNAPQTGGAGDVD